MTDTISSITGPSHTPEFRTAIDDQAGGLFDRATANMDALSIEVSIANPVPVVLNVTFEISARITSLTTCQTSAQPAQAFQSEVNFTVPEQVFEGHVGCGDVIIT